LLAIQNLPVPDWVRRSGKFCLHHPCSGKGEVVLAGTANDDVVQDADVLQRLDNLVGGVDVLFGGGTLIWSEIPNPL
jgi:hypothetical protein